MRPADGPTIHDAAKAGDVQKLLQLVASGVAVNQQNQTVGATPLVYAAQAGHVAAVKFLLEQRAALDVTTRKGKTALMVARDKGHQQVVALLEGANASSVQTPAPAANGLGGFEGFGASLSLGRPFSAPAAATPSTPFGGTPAVPSCNFGVATDSAAFGSFGQPAASAFGAVSMTNTAGRGGFGASALSTPFGGTAAAPPPSPFGVAAAPSGVGVPSMQPECAGSQGSTGTAVPTGTGSSAPTLNAEAHHGALTLPSPPDDSVSAVAFGGSDGLLASSAWDGTVRAWRVNGASWQAEHLLTYTHAAAALCTRWSTVTEAIFSGGADNAIRSVDLGSQQLALVGEHAAPVTAMSAPPQQPNCIITGSLDRSLAVWDLRAAGRPAATIALPERVHSLDVQWPHAIAGTATVGAAHLIDFRQSPPPVRETAVNANIARFPPSCVALFPPGLNEVSGGYCIGTFEGRVGVHFPGESRPQPRMNAHEKWGEDFQFKCHRHGQMDGKQGVFAVNAIAFHPRSPEQLATAGADGEAVLWDVKKRVRVRQLASMPQSGIGIPCLAFSSRGEMLAYARSDDWTSGEAKYQERWAAGTHNEVCVIPLPG